VKDDSEVIELDELEELDKLLFPSSTAEDKEDVTEDRSSFFLLLRWLSELRIQKIMAVMRTQGT
jgi:hypothetical protein